MSLWGRFSRLWGGGDKAMLADSTGDVLQEAQKRLSAERLQGEVSRAEDEVGEARAVAAEQRRRTLEVTDRAEGAADNLRRTVRSTMDILRAGHA